MSCSNSKSSDLILHKGVYISKSINESIVILSDTLAIHLYTYDSIHYNDTLHIKYFPDSGLGTTSITIFSVSDKSKLSNLNYGLLTPSLDKQLFYTYLNGVPCIMIDPETHEPLFLHK